ncbi:MAG: hypothetical protein HY208_06535 [Nitrospirae bacterium]|nr:hypothetical protein [Nitrospirota bacterium]
MKIIADRLTLAELKEMAANRFGDLVKAVVDVDRELVAVDAELHADLEACLLQDGSKQRNLWGINLYPEISGDEWVEFDSMINVRPSQGNRSRGVENKEMRNTIVRIVNQRIVR